MAEAYTIQSGKFSTIEGLEDFIADNLKNNIEQMIAENEYSDREASQLFSLWGGYYMGFCAAAPYVLTQEGHQRLQDRLRKIIHNCRHE